MNTRHRRIGASQTGALTGILAGIFMLVLALGDHGAAAQTAPSTPAQVTVPTSSHGAVTTTPRSSVTTVPRTTATTRLRAPTAPPVVVTQPYVAQVVPNTTVPPTTVAPTTTTIAGIGDQFTPGPVTLPLRTKGSNGHVDPTLAWLSGIGFALGLLLILGRLVVTRPRGRDRAPLA
jgi:hypothetical protein